MAKLYRQEVKEGSRFRQTKKQEWEFYKDNRNEWRWRATYIPNGNIAGGSSEGYKNRQDCVDNARDFGFSRFRYLCRGIRLIEG